MKKNSDEDKVIRITISYKNRVKYLEGEEAEKWMNTINNMCTLAEVHNQNPFKEYKPKWKIEGNF